MAVAWLYTSTQGEFWYGVPARDLTTDEFNALSADHQALVSNGLLYTAAP